MNTSQHDEQLSDREIVLTREMVDSRNSRPLWHRRHGSQFERGFFLEFVREWKIGAAPAGTRLNGNSGDLWFCRRLNAHPNSTIFNGCNRSGHLVGSVCKRLAVKGAAHVLYHHFGGAKNIRKRPVVTAFNLVFDKRSPN